MRKLLLTSLIIFFWPGSALQLGSGLLIALFFIVLYSSSRPYDSIGDDTLQLCCQIVIFLSYFAGLMLMVEVPQSEQPLFGTFLVVVAVLPLACAGVMVVGCAILPLLSAVTVSILKRKTRRLKQVDVRGVVGHASVRGATLGHAGGTRSAVSTKAKEMAVNRIVV